MADICSKLFSKTTLDGIGVDGYNEIHTLFQRVQKEFLKTNPDILDSFATAQVKNLFGGNKNFQFKMFLWKTFGKESGMTYDNFAKEFLSPENLEFKSLEELTGDLIIKKASLTKTIQFKKNYVTTVKAGAMSNHIVKQLNKWKKKGVKKWFQAFGKKTMSEEDIFGLVLRSMLYKSKWGDNTPLESLHDVAHSKLFYQPRVAIDKNWDAGKYPELQKKYKKTLVALNSDEVAEQIYELMNLVATGRVKVLKNGKISKDLTELTFNKGSKDTEIKVKVEEIAKDKEGKDGAVGKE